SGSLKSVSRVILRDHMEHCIVDAIERGDHTELEELNRAIDQLMK
ncbi:MAG: metal-sensing transcriptional repressor, partial [Oscillospiraceae bacterium]|nr:metal-sensing transcriptional repressor [Oscillospiraceae bacterium]